MSFLIYVDISKSVHHPVMSTDKSSAASTAAKLEEVLKAVRDVETKVDNKLSEIKWEMESSGSWLHADACPVFVR